jgi:hypothetical protein
VRLEAVGIFKKIQYHYRESNQGIFSWALLFMPLVILHHLLNVFVQLANKRGFTKKKKLPNIMFINCK